MSVLDNIKRVFTNEEQEQTNITDNGATAQPQQVEPPELYIARLEAERTQKDHYFKHSPYGPIEDRINFR